MKTILLAMVTLAMTNVYAKQNQLDFIDFSNSTHDKEILVCGNLNHETDHYYEEHRLSLDWEIPTELGGGFFEAKLYPENLTSKEVKALRQEFKKLKDGEMLHACIKGTFSLYVKGRYTSTGYRSSSDLGALRGWALLEKQVELSHVQIKKYDPQDGSFKLIKN